ncbi:MAG: hypothetical protein V3U54_10900 [Thermodesulfobacteriota bacterium]
MGKPPKITRNYSMADAAMVEFALTILGQFKDDKAAFVSYDPDFGGTFEADWQADITAAEEVPSDEALVDAQEGLTRDVEQLMEDCRHKFQDSKRFIEKAFPDDKPVHNEFGYDNYGASRDVQTKMIFFMENFHRVAEKYSTQLIAQNYTQAHIDEIETLHDQLHDANEEQEGAKGGRPVVTQDRIIILNKPWDTTADVSRAAKAIFHKDAAKLKSYLLPASESGDEPEPPPVQ